MSVALILNITRKIIYIYIVNYDFHVLLYTETFSRIVLEGIFISIFSSKFNVSVDWKLFSRDILFFYFAVKIVYQKLSGW